jgi:hypothetical protein
VLFLHDPGNGRNRSGGRPTLILEKDRTVCHTGPSLRSASNRGFRWSCRPCLDRR